MPIFTTTSKSPLLLYGIFSSEISPMIALSIQLLLFVLIWDASILFAELDQQIYNVLRRTQVSELESYLESWRRKHFLVCTLVHDINRCFGMTMLVSIVYYLISFTTDISTILNIFGLCRSKASLFKAGFKVHMIFLVIKNLFQFSTLIIAPYNLQAKVSSESALRFPS